MQTKIFTIAVLLARSNAQLFAGLTEASIDTAETIKEVKAETNDATGHITANSMPNLTIDIGDLIGLENPISAEGDIASQAQADASQAILEFQKNILKSIKITSDYENMNQEQKASFDAQYTEQNAAAELFDNADRNTSGFHQMDNTAKAIYDSEMLKWTKKVTKDCAESETAPGCLFSQMVREAETTDRVKAGYYELEEKERTTWDEKRAYENASLIAAQTEQWHVDNVPAYGNVGSACSRQNACLDKSHCCGVFTRFDNNTIQLNGRCHSQGDAYTDKLGYQWTHQCGASKLFAAATALLVSAYLI